MTIYKLQMSFFQQILMIGYFDIISASSGFIISSIMLVCANLTSPGPNERSPMPAKA